MAAKQDGPAPESNPRLRLAVQNAKSANLPKENIERAIKKGSSRDATTYTEVTYEGHATHGVAVIVACMTDNLNRTVSTVRAVFAKHGGNLGKSGALAFLFDRKGVFTIKKGVTTNEEELTLAMIEAGAETIEPEEELFHITCPLETFGHVQRSLEAMQVTIEDAALEYMPRTFVSLPKDVATQVTKLIDALEELDDVHNVFHNMALSS